MTWAVAQMAKISSSFGQSRNGGRGNIEDQNDLQFLLIGFGHFQGVP